MYEEIWIRTQERNLRIQNSSRICKFYTKYRAKQEQNCQNTTKKKASHDSEAFAIRRKQGVQKLGIKNSIIWPRILSENEEKSIYKGNKGSKLSQARVFKKQNETQKSSN